MRYRDGELRRGELSGSTLPEVCRIAQPASISRGARSRWTFPLLNGLVWLFAGCALSASGGPGADPVAPQDSLCCSRASEAITLEYLGVGGWLIRMGDASILTAPFFSNPGLVEVGIQTIEADTAMIDRFLPPVSDVTAILVGHAHYDHLMDIPYILRRKAPRALMYGSRTAVNLVHGDVGIAPARLREMESIAGSAAAPGEWVSIADGRIRFMPLLSGHAPHFMGVQLYRGEVDRPAIDLPDRAGGWLEGQTLAFLIDFLSEEGDVVFRIHYQDAASTPPAGFPPTAGDGIPVDLVILCPPGFEEVDDYPEGILRALSPRLVMLGHWEDFFRPRTEPIRPLRATDFDEFVARLEGAMAPGAEWKRPEPGEVVRIGSR